MGLDSTVGLRQMAGITDPSTLMPSSGFQAGMAFWLTTLRGPLGRQASLWDYPDPFCRESGRGLGDGTRPESLPSMPRVTARVETQLPLPGLPSHSPRVRSLGFCSVILCRPVNQASTAQSEPPGRGEQVEGRLQNWLWLG